MQKTFELDLPTEEELLNFGSRLAALSLPPLCIYLHGQLGAGKTTMVRGFLRGLGYKDRVKSPSYNLVEIYELEQKSIFHFDFYRIQDPQELEFIGVQDYWQPTSIFLIEWPEKGGQLLPPVDLAIYLEIAGSGRSLKAKAETEAGERILAGL